MSKPKPIKPNNNQESVWDYPRPPRLEKSSKRIQIIFNGVQIADSQRAWRVLETSHPPVYYIPPEDIRMELLNATSGSSFCEWKGEAAYFDLEVAGKFTAQAAWSYPNPTRNYVEIKDHLAFYAAPMDICLVDGEEAQPQPGNFYGGWVTGDIVGPFKGEPGTSGW